MKCKISNWGCPYHACCSDDCKKQQVLKNGCDFGKGLCEIQEQKEKTTDAEKMEILSPSVIN